MIFLIAGASHTGKTLLAQKLLEKYKYPYLSIDHLKMGLIRSGKTTLTPKDDDKLTDFLWPIVLEMIKTAIENNQNLIVEGYYIPYDYKKDFTGEYLAYIKYVCLIFSESYIENNYNDIINFGSIIEKRLNNYYLKGQMIEDNKKTLEECEKYGCEYILIDRNYDITWNPDIILTSERLLLRRLTNKDFDSLCNILQDEEVMYAYEHAFSDLEVHEWLNKQLKRYEVDGVGLWAVILKETGEMIGQCGLTFQDCEGKQVLEVGYLFQKSFWHKGYATEAAIACKKYAFDVLKSEEVFSIIRDTNIASQTVALRNEMTIKSKFTKHYYDVDMPHLVYSITKEDYFKKLEEKNDD